MHTPLSSTSHKCNVVLQIERDTANFLFLYLLLMEMSRDDTQELQLAGHENRYAKRWKLPFFKSVGCAKITRLQP